MYSRRQAGRSTPEPHSSMLIFLQWSIWIFITSGINKKNWDNFSSVQSSQMNSNKVRFHCQVDQENLFSELFSSPNCEAHILPRQRWASWVLGDLRSFTLCSFLSHCFQRWGPSWLRTEVRIRMSSHIHWLLWFKSSMRNHLTSLLLDFIVRLYTWWTF